MFCDSSQSVQTVQFTTLGSSKPEEDKKLLKGVTIVQNEQQARRALQVLMSEPVRSRFHACDTETTGIDVKAQSPVGNGMVICASVYCGSDVDFGNGFALAPFFPNHSDLELP